MAAVEAVSVAARRGDRLLLVLRGRAPSKGFYAFPGGRVDPGEALEDAARRELAEETGLAAGPLRAIREFVLEPEAGETAPVFHLTVFGCDSAEGGPQAADDAAEAAFFTLDEMRAMPVLASVMEVATALLGPAPR